MRCYSHLGQMVWPTQLGLDPSEHRQHDRNDFSGGLSSERTQLIAVLIPTPKWAAA